MFNIEAKGAKETAEKLRVMQEHARNMGPYFNFAGLAMVRSIQKNFQQGGRPEKWKPSIRVRQGGGKTLSETAAMRQSVTQESGPNSATVGTNARQAKVLHFGGKITPKKAKALAVPVSKEARESKGPRQYQRMHRGEDKVFMIIRSGGRAPILARSRFKGRGKGRAEAGIEVMWVLMKSVTIPARPFMLFQTEDISRLNKAAEKFILTGKAPE